MDKRRITDEEAISTILSYHNECGDFNVKIKETENRGDLFLAVVKFQWKLNSWIKDVEHMEYVVLAPDGSLHVVSGFTLSFTERNTTDGSVKQWLPEKGST